MPPFFCLLSSLSHSFHRHSCEGRGPREIMKTYYVYILASKKYGTLLILGCTGITEQPHQKSTSAQEEDRRGFSSKV